MIQSSQLLKSQYLADKGYGLAAAFCQQYRNMYAARQKLDVHLPGVRVHHMDTNNGNNRSIIVKLILALTIMMIMEHGGS